MRVVDLGLAAQRLAIGDLRRADVGVDLVGTAQDVDLDVEVQFAHALEAGLAGLVVGRDAEGRILSGETLQREAQLLLVGLGLRLNGDLDDRLGEFHLLEDDRFGRVAQGVARGRFLEGRHRDDVAGESFLDVFPIVRMHFKHAADTLLLVLGGVEERGARVERAGIDAAERDRADERVVHDLECEHRQRRIVRLRALDFRIILGVDALDGRHVERRRQVVDNRVEQRLDALVLERGAAQHRVEGAGQNGLADEALDRCDVRLLALEERGHDVVIEFRNGLDQDGAVFSGLVGHVVGDRHDVELRAEVFALPHNAAHLDEIDHAFERVLDADRELQWNRLHAETLHQVADAGEEVCANLVHLVCEDDPRNLVLVGLAPDGFRLRLDALVPVENRNGAVENAQRAFDLNRKVDVSGRVDDVQALVLPEAGRRGGRDRDAALLFLFHPVHGGCAIVDFADLVRLAGIVKNPFGDGRLAGVDVRHDPEVSVIGKLMAARHGEPSEFVLRRTAGLPAIVREGAVGFRHPVRVFTLLHR